MSYEFKRGHSQKALLCSVTSGASADMTQMSENDSDGWGLWQAGLENSLAGWFLMCPASWLGWLESWTQRALSTRVPTPGLFSMAVLCRITVIQGLSKRKMMLWGNRQIQNMRLYTLACCLSKSVSWGGGGGRQLFLIKWDLKDIIRHTPWLNPN